LKGIVLRWLILTFAVFMAAYMIDGIRISGLPAAVWAAAALGVLNAFLRPVLLIITLPLTILTLGLFTFAINAIMLMMASGVIRGFEVDGFGSALLASLFISIVSWLLTSFIGRQGTIQYIDLRHQGGNRWE